MAYKNGDAVFAEDINKAINDSTTAVNTANTAKTASDKASADVIDLGKQIGTKQGTTVTVGGVAQNAVAFTSDPQTQIDNSHPIGSIYQSVNATSPASLFGGSWEQLAADAYLKIVTSGAGNLGGTNAQQKIPIESIPSHGYHLPYGGSNTQGGNCNLFLRNDVMTSVPGAGRGWNDLGTEMYPAGFNLGGGQPYYPYYYGIYMWVRTA